MNNTLKNDVIEMPKNWDDHDGWERYYASLPSDEKRYKTTITNPGSFSFDRLGAFIDDLIEHNKVTLWFPGCGFSPLPRLFATYGFTVHATDISRSAIHYQNTNKDIITSLLEKVTITRNITQPGSLHTQVHDFRTIYIEDSIDVIFNIKSLQGLPLTSMQQASKSHFNALRPNSLAFFDTMNVQGVSRDLLERTLMDAGFYVPLYNLNKWYRQSLADTKIPHVFLLGSPIIPQSSDYPHKHDSVEYKRDREILHNITKEYRSRMKAEYEKEQQAIGENAKLANIIYSTG